MDRGDLQATVHGGRKELDTTERLSTHTSMNMLGNTNCRKMFNMKLCKIEVTAIIKYALFSVTHRALSKNDYKLGHKTNSNKVKTIEIKVCSWRIKGLN